MGGGARGRRGGCHRSRRRCHGTRARSAGAVTALWRGEGTRELVERGASVNGAAAWHRRRGEQTGHRADGRRGGARVGWPTARRGAAFQAPPPPPPPRGCLPQAGPGVCSSQGGAALLDGDLEVAPA